MSAALAKLSDAEVDSMIAQARHLLFGAFSLAQVAANREGLQECVERIMRARGAAGVPDDLWDGLASLDELLAGKIDRIADRIKTEIPAFVEGLKASFQAAVAGAEALEERLKGLVLEACALIKEDEAKAKGDKAKGYLIGARWRARIAANGRPKVVVVDERLVPAKYQRRRLTISLTFPASEKPTLKYWREIMKDWEAVPGFKASMMDEVDSDGIYQDWKAFEPPAAPEGQKPADFLVPGVSIEVGSHVVIEESKAAAAPLPKPIPLPEPKKGASACP